ncbi:MAG: hypothetical protein L3J72_04915, partial [Thermoplasmata archaeon]|nr:hypothetical protein [Thermoplasmata archaeon]
MSAPAGDSVRTLRLTLAHSAAPVVVPRVTSRGERGVFGSFPTRTTVWVSMAIVLVMVLPGAFASSPLGAHVPVPAATAARGPAGPGSLGSAMLAEAASSLSGPASTAPISPAGSLHPSASALDWNQTGLNSSQPAIRAAAGLAYDPILQRTVLFGGYNPNVSAFGDTWEFARGGWTDLNLSASASPPARWNPELVFDAADGYLLLYGGRNTTQFFNDSWSFNGTNWTHLGTTLAPPWGYGSMTYDAKDGYVLFFGAAHGNLPSGTSSSWSDLNVTWEFRGGLWTNLTSSVVGSPSQT